MGLGMTKSSNKNSDTEGMDQDLCGRTAGLSSEYECTYVYVKMTDTDTQPSSSEN